MKKLELVAARWFIDGSYDNYDASIDWGDGTTTAVTGSPDSNAGLVHTFASAGRSHC